MSAPLLQLVPHPPLEREGQVALIQEFVVDPRLFPYLVSGARDTLLWVEKPFPQSIVRAAVRHDQEFDLLFRTAVEKILERGQVYEYGNSFPLTEEGVQTAIAYVSYFLEGSETEIVNPLDTKVQVLTSEDSPWAEQDFFEAKGSKFPVLSAPWLPKRTVIAVPLDRGFVGDLHVFGKTSCAVVVHNPTRGVAIACEE